MDKFWSKVLKSDGCWLWTGAEGGGVYRYGAFCVDGKMVGAHRVSYRLVYGEIPKGLEICHRCDVPKCVRPDHLFAASHLENMRDSQAKGRMSGSLSKGVCKRGHVSSPENSGVNPLRAGVYCRECRRVIEKQRPKRNRDWSKVKRSIKSAGA